MRFSAAPRRPASVANRGAAADQLWAEHGWHLGRTGVLLLVGAVMLAALAANLLGLSSAVAG